MANFYNPYMKTPDYASGISDMLNQFLQILMMKKMFPGNRNQGQAQITPQPNAQMPTGVSRLGQYGATVPQPSATMGQQPTIPPDILQLLIKLLGGLGGTPGMGAGL